MNLTKPTTTTSGTTIDADRMLEAIGTVSVNVGVPGNIKKVSIGLNNATVREALAAANLNPKGYDIRVAGESVGLDAPLTDNQTVLLLRPVVGNLDLTKPAAEAAGIAVNVGVPGNIKKVSIGLNATVREALAAANLKPKGYDIRVAGESVGLDSPLTDNQTVLLLRPVVGNLDLTKPTEEAMGITVNVGVPGNIKKVVLAGNKRWTVGDALSQAGMTASGYDVRVSGETVTTDSPINDGQTVLLLRPVKGN